MEIKKFPRLPHGLFRSVQEEEDYLYQVLDFTLRLDAIEDANLDLVPFLKTLVEYVIPFLHVDEAALILKDMYSQYWSPLISYPDTDAIHKEVTMEHLLKFSEIAFASKEPVIHSIDYMEGWLLAYPLVFKEEALGVLLLFVYEALHHPGKEQIKQIPAIFDETTPEYHSLMRMLWYFNELENDAIWERLEISETQTLFAKYVSPQVMSEILQQHAPVNLGGVEVEVSVLFADFCDFTKLSRRLAPKTLVTVINTYFTALVDIVFKYKGTLDKFIGDCIMVVFNTPIPQDNHQHRACAAALAMVECVEHMKRQPEFQEYQIEISIGINSGVALSGHIGAKDRLEYTVIGDVVNLASRLESIAGNNGIVIGQHVFEAVEGGFVCKRFESFNIKGHDGPITAYYLLGFMPPETIKTEFLEQSMPVQNHMLMTLSMFSISQHREMLMLFLRSCAPQTGIFILQLFERYFCVEVLPELTRWINKLKEPFLMAQGVKTIGFLGGAPYFKTLLPFLQHEDIRVISNTIEAIGLTQDANVGATIAPFLEHENHRISLQASCVYWEEDHEKAMTHFLEALTSDNEIIKKAAIVLLTEINSKHLFFSFLERYTHLEPQQREEIKKVVEAFGSHRMLYYLNFTEDNLKSSCG
ncbi:adenylate/guanylate cyclase domain-containing protein [Deltaproteobacteria bacterium TL4]